jgi:hypothetical protein
MSQGAQAPTSLGVNPSLTISAVCERAPSELVGGADDLGLPAAPRGLVPRRPPEIIGDRVVAPDNDGPRPMRRRAQEAQASP